MTTTISPAALLSVEDLTVDYPLGRGRKRRAVDGVSLSIRSGQTLGLVGESGSGKSTIGRALLGMAPVTAGRLSFAGKELGGESVRRRRPVTDLQIVFQDPYSSLDPTKTIGYSLAEPLHAERARDPQRAAAKADFKPDALVADMLQKVGLPASAATRFPAQFSGGQRQRIAIARSLIVQPKLVICDEAVSALDLSIQAQILNLLTTLQQDMGLSYLFISHDLSVVEHISEQVVVLYRGRVMESGIAAQVHRSPEHPYTRALTASAPVHDPALQRERRQLRQLYRKPPTPPAPLGNSCPYVHRCPFVIDRCSAERPLPQPTPSGGTVACHRYGELPADQALPAQTNRTEAGR